MVVWDDCDDFVPNQKYNSKKKHSSSAENAWNANGVTLTQR